MKSITSKELAELIKIGTDIQLIDVRETNEHEAFNIGGTNIPLQEITKSIMQIEKDIPVVIYCRVGIRSQIAIQRLQEKYCFYNLTNLIGGTEAWRKQFPVE